MKILHIDTSINGQGSASRRISAEAVKRLVTQHADTEIVYRDLAAAPLPHLTLAEFAETGSQAALAEFQAANIIVIGAGMYNFSVPSQLKAWIDRIVIAGQTFHYTETGPEGLVRGKRVVIALARGGYYGADSSAAALEHAETYLRGVFAFIGVRDVTVVNADGMSIPGNRESAIEAAEQRAAALAA